MNHAGPAILTLAQSLTLESLLPALGVLLIVLGLFMLMRKRHRKRKSGTQITAREQLERMKQEKAVRGDLEHLMVELEQLTRRFSAQLDAKTIHVEKLLREADQRIARLEQLEQIERPQQEDNRRISATSYASPPPEPPQAEKPPAAADDEATLKQSVYDLADRGETPLQIARQLNEHVGKIELVLALRQT